MVAWAWSHGTISISSADQQVGASSCDVHFCWWWSHGRTDSRWLVLCMGRNNHGQCGCELSEEDVWESGEVNDWCDNGTPRVPSVWEVARVTLPARVRFVCAGDTL